MTYRRQRPVKGGRQPLPACVMREIAEVVEAESRRWKVSKLFVIAVALADVFGIADQEEYIGSPVTTKKSKRGYARR